VPTFRSLLFGGALSFAAPSGVLVVLVWAITVSFPMDPSGKDAALALTLLGLSATIPTLASALVSGTIADRFDRRQTMLAVNAMGVLAILLMIAVLYAHPDGSVTVPGARGFALPEWIVLLYPLWAVLTVSSALFRPAFNASLPRVLPVRDLGTGNGLIYSVAVVASVAASVGASALVETESTWLALVISLALLVATQIAIRTVRANLDPDRSGPVRRFLAQAAEGYRYLWKRKELLEITLGALAINFLNALAFVELGVYVRDWLGIGQAVIYGTMVAGSSLGVAVGALYVARLRFEPRAGPLVILCAFGMGLAVLALGLVRTVWIAMPAIFVFGIFPGMLTTVLFAALQATVPNELLGRVMAADEVGSYALVPAGQYAGGLVTLSAGIQVTYLAAGAGTILVGLVLSLFKQLRNFGFEPEPEPPIPQPPSPMTETAVEPTALS
jgi:MFS family permease